MKRLGNTISGVVYSPLRGAMAWSVFLAMVMSGPAWLSDLFWFLRPLREAPALARLVVLCGAWLIVLGGSWRGTEKPETKPRSDRTALHAIWASPILALLFWFFRDRERTTGDAELFTWALDLGAPLRVSHAPLTQVVLDNCGRMWAELLGLPLPDGVALCVAAIAAAFVPAFLAVLRPLPRGRRWPFVWLVSGSSLLVLAFGQIEIYVLPAALQILFLFSAWIWLATGANWWLSIVLFPLLLLSGLWNGMFLPLYVWLVARIWRNDPERRGLLLSLVYSGVGFIVVFYVLNRPLLGDTWRTLTHRVATPDFLLIAREGVHAGFLSAAQLWGLLNVSLGILAPVWPLLGAVRGYDSRHSGRWATTGFPLAALGLVIPLALIWNPWFGYERDVDLFSFLSPPILLCVGVFIGRCRLAMMPHRCWMALFLLGLLPAAGEVAGHSGLWTGECWRGPLTRVEAWMRPDVLASRPHERMMAGDERGAVRMVSQIEMYAPRLRANLAEFLDVGNIRRLVPGGMETGKRGWAQDLVFWGPPKTVLIVDAWGRLFTHDGERLTPLELHHPLPLDNEPVVAMARGPRMELNLLHPNGGVTHGHQAVNEPPGSWTWRTIPPPDGIADAWPADEAVDLAYDDVLNRILVLDRLGGVHAAGGETLAPHPPPDFDEAVSLARLDEGWSVVTRRGRCYPLSGENLGDGPRVSEPGWLGSPVFVDGAVEADGGGRILLDEAGVLHPIAEATYYQPFYAGGESPPFRRLALNVETRQLALLDAMYQVAWVDPDVDGVMVLHRIAGAEPGDATAVLKLAKRSWLQHEPIRTRMLELIADNPHVSHAAQHDPLWTERSQQGN